MNQRTIQAGKIRIFSRGSNFLKINHYMNFRTAWMVIASLSAFSAMATVRPFANFEQNGIPILIPAVQKYSATDESFHLPEKFTVFAPDSGSLELEQISKELSRFSGVKLEKSNSKQAVCRLLLTDKETPENPQGYLLTIDKNGIEIAARKPAGLFYGVQTLRNILANTASPELKGCRIKDWPDFERRGYFFNLRYMKPEDVPNLKKAIDTMASLKINWLLLGLGEAFPYKDNPLINRPNAISKETLREIIEFCRARQIEITPFLQVLTHTRWMTYHPDWDKMKEGKPDVPWNCQCCPQNVEAQKLTKKAIVEQIEFFKPEIFFLMLDEIYLGPFRSCPKCKKVAPMKLLTDYLKFAENVVSSRGVRSMVCQDGCADRIM